MDHSDLSWANRGAEENLRLCTHACAIRFLQSSRIHQLLLTHSQRSRCTSRIVSARAISLCIGSYVGSISITDSACHVRSPSPMPACVSRELG